MTENFETIVKWFIAITGLISVIIKFTDSVSENRRKRNLKTDLELLEKIDSSNLEQNEKNRINEKIKNVLDEYLNLDQTTLKWFDVFYALILFVGFGWWTIYIYEINTNFSPWTILTGLISFIGLALLIDKKTKKKEKEKVLLKITILKDFKIALVVLGLGFLIAFFLFKKFDGYTNWYILIGVLIPIGFKILFDNIKLN